MVRGRGLTVMPDSVPAKLLITVSLAVMDWLPALRKIAEKIWIPASEEVKV